jgi:renal tumor antigen
MMKEREKGFSEAYVKKFMFQLLKALHHMHKNGIFHRDIKPENIMVSDEQVKLIDFGSCRGIYSKLPYTEYISTRWYRPPECLLSTGYYNFKVSVLLPK